MTSLRTEDLDRAFAYLSKTKKWGSEPWAREDGQCKELAEEFAAVRAEERDRCVKIARDMSEEWERHDYDHGPSLYPSQEDVLDDLANRIRDLKDQP